MGLSQASLPGYSRAGGVGGDDSGFAPRSNTQQRLMQFRGDKDLFFCRKSFFATDQEL